MVLNYILVGCPCKVTEECRIRFSEGKDPCLVSFKYQGRCEKYNVCEDMPLLVTENMRDRHLFNMQECFVRSIIEEDNGELTFEVSLKDNDDEFEGKKIEQFS